MLRRMECVCQAVNWRKRPQVPFSVRLPHRSKHLQLLKSLKYRLCIGTLTLRLLWAFMLAIVVLGVPVLVSPCRP